MNYLLDTNVISDLIRNSQDQVARHITSIGETDICTSIVVIAELRYSGAKSGSTRLIKRINLILSAIEILPLASPVDQAYAHLRHFLAQQGNPIGPNDLLIAAHALSEHLTVVTANTREFSRVPQLPLENWLEA